MRAPWRLHVSENFCFASGRDEHYWAGYAWVAGGGTESRIWLEADLLDVVRKWASPFDARVEGTYRTKASVRRYLKSSERYVVIHQSSFSPSSGYYSPPQMLRAQS
jgi:hypothetical protein